MGNILDSAIDLSEVSERVARKVSVAEDFEHPETHWRSRQFVGVWLEGWFLYPTIRGTRERIPMMLSTKDHDLTRGQMPREGVVLTDLLRDAQYNVRSESCGAGCHCDASAELVAAE